MWNLANHKGTFVNSDFNISAIIRTTFDTETIYNLLIRGSTLGLKYYKSNTYEESCILTAEQIIECINQNLNQTKIEIVTKTNHSHFMLIFENSYSPKANQHGLGCNFKKIKFTNTQTDKIECIKLMLGLINDYFIYELHAQKNEYVNETD